MTITSLAELSTKLVELESHPGREHVRRYTPTGATALRWVFVDALLGQMWDDLADQTDDLDRANAAYPEVLEFFDTVDEINTTVAKRISPSLKQIDVSGVAVPKDVTDLLAAAASDPLSLTADEIDERIAAITEVIALQTHWPDALSGGFALLDTLRQAVAHAAETRDRARQTVLTGPLPVAVDAGPDLRAELESLEAPDPAALLDVRRRIESALDRVRRDEALAQGLLDRRIELTGRLRAYAAKATRLGLADDTELSASRRAATELLKQRPCDLRSATQAIVDYQQLVSAKREQTR